MVSDEAFFNFCLIIFFLLPAIFMISECFKSTRYARDSAYEDDNWFCWRVTGGLVVYIVGMGINVTSDYALLNLKHEAGGGHKIPRGGLFELVSCPNYFGEIIEWFGWAMVAWSWAIKYLFLNTFAILIPRGIARHKWYMEKFRKEYPENRKAVLPFAC